ncbi:beta-1,3-galactosyltransferase 7-like isoform X2 [Spinacia oleracea]|uniref:Hexosyltransferase n=1 Tax=Spinacia oleracea TaxID=3562 RepID=A0ABM3QW97_SPIOL|nr:beta-1,3-galactosyltransferase 7-like isoform X2 [Spinacia oleracea]
MILWCSQLQKRVIHISYEASCEKICKEYKSAVKPAAPCVKIEPGNNEGSATCPSQDVSTPKPPALSSKGGRTTTQLKKPKTAKRMASAIKDPTASKSKMQSHMKSAKPAGGFRRKTKLLRGRSWKMEKLDSATSNTILDRAIDSEEAQHHDFLRLEHIEGYHELSAKTKIYFSTAVAKWDADFYVKVDDDVHLNLGVFASTLAHYRSKPRVYIKCMKSGPVLADKNVKYHEPEFWKFGDDGNKYFRHATGQIYAISKDLATYISINQWNRFASG